MKKQLIWLLSSRGWVKNASNSLLYGWADLSSRRNWKKQEETWRQERKGDAVCGLDLWEMTLHLSATFPSEVPASTGLPGWTHLAVRMGIALLVSQPGVWAHCQRARTARTAVSGRLPAGSECSHTGWLLTHSILEKLTFEQDLSWAWHLQKAPLKWSHNVSSHFPDSPHHNWQNGRLF